MNESPPDLERRLRVILADDDALTRRAVKRALQRAGVLVIAEASSGREAAALAIHYRPDCVLMDVVMPDLDGLEAARRIAAQAPEICVVMLTAGENPALDMLARTLRARSPRRAVAYADQIAIGASEAGLH